MFVVPLTLPDALILFNQLTRMNLELPFDRAISEVRNRSLESGAERPRAHASPRRHMAALSAPTICPGAPEAQANQGS